MKVMLRLLLILFAFVGSAFCDEGWGAQPGSRDYIQYWGAYQVAKDGGNPYSPEAMLEVQRRAGYQDHLPVMMWNPPWTLLVIAPLLGLPFESSRVLGLYVNVALLLASVFLLRSVAERSMKADLFDRPLALTVITSVLFYPALDSIHSGQTGVFLVFVVSLSLFFLSRGHQFSAGLLLSLLSIKPHLFILLGLYAMICAVRRAPRLLIGGMLGGILLVLATVLIMPGVMSMWIHAMVNPPDPSIAVPVTMWWSETLPGVIRGVTYSVWGERMDWLMGGIPSVVALLFIVRWRHGVFQPVLDLPFVVALSVLCAPYGWFSDYAVLLPLHVLVISVMPTNKMIAILSGIQIGFWGMSTVVPTFHSFVWVMAVALIYCYRRCSGIVGEINFAPTSET